MGDIRYTETVVVGAPLQRVFDYRLDFDHLPEVNPYVTALRRTDGGDRPGVGARWEFEVEIPGIGKVPSSLEVVEADVPVRIVNDMESAGTRAREICTFTPADEGTHVSFEVIVEVPGEIPDEERAMREKRGREMIRLELDLMRKNLES